MTEPLINCTLVSLPTWNHTDCCWVWFLWGCLIQDVYTIYTGQIIQTAVGCGFFEVASYKMYTPSTLGKSYRLLLGVVSLRLPHTRCIHYLHMGKSYRLLLGVVSLRLPHTRCIHYLHMGKSYRLLLGVVSLRLPHTRCIHYLHMGKSYRLLLGVVSLRLPHTRCIHHLHWANHTDCCWVWFLWGCLIQDVYTIYTGQIIQTAVGCGFFEVASYKMYTPFTLGKSNRLLLGVVSLRLPHTRCIHHLHMGKSYRLLLGVVSLRLPHTRCIHYLHWANHTDCCWVWFLWGCLIQDVYTIYTGQIIQTAVGCGFFEVASYKMYTLFTLGKSYRLLLGVVSLRLPHTRCIHYLHWANHTDCCWVWFLWGCLIQDVYTIYTWANHTDCCWVWFLWGCLIQDVYTIYTGQIIQTAVGCGFFEVASYKMYTLFTLGKSYRLLLGVVSLRLPHTRCIHYLHWANHTDCCWVWFLWGCLIQDVYTIYTGQIIQTAVGCGFFEVASYKMYTPFTHGQIIQTAVGCGFFEVASYKMYTPFTHGQIF